MRRVFLGARALSTVRVATDDAGAIATITLTRPEARNALSEAMGSDLQAALERLPFPHTRCTIITGSGRAFCAGADLKERADMSDDRWEQQHARFRSAAAALLDVPCPVIAAVDGAALGGGFELALLADWIVASPRARFGFPEVRLGILPGLGAPVTLAHAAGPQVARRLILSGETIDAEAALACGVIGGGPLVDDPLEEARRQARAVAAAAPGAVRRAKQAVALGPGAPGTRPWAPHRQHYLDCVASTERRAGIAAFLAGRTPTFGGAARAYSSMALDSMALGDDFPEARDAVAKICADFPGAYWRDLDRRAAYPTKFVDTLQSQGWLSSLIPPKFGGAGLPLRAAAVILETIHASPGSAAACHAQMYIQGTILRHASEDMKRAVLPQIAAGDARLQAFAVTEPESGSDTAALRTRAVRDGAADHYVVTGNKLWTSRALHSDLMLLLARTSDPAAGPTAKPTDGLSVFLVDMRDLSAQPGAFDVKKIDTMVNHSTCELFFNAARIPATSLVGEEGHGFHYLLDGINAERVLIASECVGNARYFLGRATAYANDRVVFGKPIGANQGIQFPLARAHAETEAADLMARKAAALFDAGQPCGAEANMAKLLASEAAWNAAEAAMQTFGGFAFARDFDVERKWREARLYLTAPISTNLVLAFVGQHVMGLPKSY